MLSRRKLILGAAASGLILQKRRALAFGGGSSPDPYTLPILPGYNPGWTGLNGSSPVAISSLVGTKGVIVAFGDSVHSDVVNSLYTRTQTTNYNFNIFNGALYPSVEPLIGCNYNTTTTITSGSIWTRIADNLIANAVYQNVILIPMGLGGSLLADYAAGGALNGRFAPVAARLASAGLTVTGIHCLLGANDGPAGTTNASATASLTSIISTIRAIWATQPLFIATHSLFNLTTYSAIATAQQAAWNGTNHVYDGGNFDSLTSSADYWDNTHPNATGAAAMASLVTTAITAHP